MKCGLDFETQRWMDILHFPKIYIAFEVLKISKLQELLTRKNIQKPVYG
jgi:hypothetical protein